MSVRADQRPRSVSPMCSWPASPRTAGSMSRTTWPKLAPDAIAGFAGRPYAEVAHDVIAPFVGGEIAEADLRRMCAEAYARFRHRAVAPLVQIGPGRVGARAVPRADARLQGRRDAAARAADGPRPRRRGERTTHRSARPRATPAARRSRRFAGRENVDLFILFPDGRVSPFQQRQMTTTGAANVHAIAVEGTFDDCQAMVKAAVQRSRLPRRVWL